MSTLDGPCSGLVVGNDCLLTYEFSGKLRKWALPSPDAVAGKAEPLGVLNLKHMATLRHSQQKAAFSVAEDGSVDAYIKCMQVRCPTSCAYPPSTHTHTHTHTSPRLASTHTLACADTHAWQTPQIRRSPSLAFTRIIIIITILLLFVVVISSSVLPLSLLTVLFLKSIV